MPLHHWSPQAIVSVFRYQSVCPGGSLWQSEQSTSNKMCLPDFDVHQWKNANSAPWIWHWVPWEHPQVNNNTGWTNVQVQLFSQSTGRLFKMPLATQSADCSWCDCCWNRCLELWISITKWFPCGSSPWNNRCHLHLSEVWFLICTQRVSCFLVSWCRFDPEGAWWKHVHHFQGKHTSAGQAKAVAWIAFLLPAPVDYFCFSLSKTKLKCAHKKLLPRSSVWQSLPGQKATRPCGHICCVLESPLLEPHFGWKFPVFLP